MRRLLALLLASAIVSLGLPAVSYAAGPQAQPANGQVAGTAQTGAGSPIANATVRLRNTASGDVAATAKTDAGGAYSFGRVPAGNYVAELVDGNGAVIATSMPVSLTSGSMSVTGLALTAANGKAGVGAVGTTTGVRGLFTTTGGILLVAATAGGAVAGIIGATKTTSPSR